MSAQSLTKLDSRCFSSVKVKTWCDFCFGLVRLVFLLAPFNKPTCWQANILRVQFFCLPLLELVLAAAEVDWHVQPSARRQQTEKKKCIFPFATCLTTATQRPRHLDLKSILRTIVVKEQLSFVSSLISTHSLGPRLLFVLLSLVPFLIPPRIKMFQILSINFVYGQSHSRQTLCLGRRHCNSRLAIFSKSILRHFKG